jgi:hypothetical protein
VQKNSFEYLKLASNLPKSQAGESGGTDLRFFGLFQDKIGFVLPQVLPADITGRTNCQVNGSFFTRLGTSQ